MSTSYETLVEDFAVPHRAKDAFWRLLTAGNDALTAVRAGLNHDNADVRSWCCRYLDHFADGDSMGSLIAMLDDADPEVRLWSLHALGCDHCKENDACSIDTASLLPRAIAMLRTEDDVRLRAQAVGIIGKYVHSHPTAVGALLDAHTNDASSAVRKKAGWYVPGGALYKRTAPKPVRVKRNAAA